MNHQTYEEWLFTHYDDRGGEKLTVQQENDLQTHLQGCAECRQLAQAWQHVGARLRAAPQIEPEPGFIARWQARLEIDAQRVQRKQTMAALGFSLAGAVMLFASLLLLALPWMQAPKALVWAAVYRLITLLTYVQAAQGFVIPVFQTALGAIPTFWWLVFIGLITELGVLWVVSYRFLTNPRRITQ